MCGIIGLISQRDISHDIYNGLNELQHRGQDSAGFFLYNPDAKKYVMIKGLGLIRDEIPPERLEELISDSSFTFGIAQVRYPTIGRGSEVDRRKDTQPTYTSTPGFAMAHNGNVANIDELREELASKRRYPKSECDVEIINLLLAEEVSKITNDGEITKDALFKGVKNIMGKIKGSYSVISIIRDVGFLAFRDPYGIRPLVIGKKEDGSIGFASESIALEKIGYHLVGDLKGGQVAFIPEGTLDLDIETLIEMPQKHCMFERIYFARPASIIDEDSVYEKRIRVGEILGSEMLQNHPDIVKRIEKIAPVPDTSRPAANALARVLDKQYREVFDKNRYALRTFIAPDGRKDMVKSKLFPIKSEIEGYSIGIVDDSIVRGNTSRVIVEMLREAGAKEVHFIVANAPNRYPCHLGIDMATREELIAANNPIEEIRKFIDADSLIYLSEEGLKKAIGENYCYGCITGEYPIPPVEAYVELRKKERKN